MKNASKMIRDWSKNCKRVLPNHWHLTKARLSLKGGTYCHLTGKGWHTTVVLQFLMDFMGTLPNVDPLMRTCVWSANNVLGLLQWCRDRSVLLTEQEIEQVQTVGSLYQSSYLRLHLNYQNFCPYLLFNLRPKFHLLEHFFQSCLRVRNPLCSSTWMDESWIGAVMRLASKCHQKTVQKSALQRYCAGLRFIVIPCVVVSLGNVAGLKHELDAALALLPD